MHVSDREFVAAVELVRTVAEIVPLRDLVDRHRAGRPTRGLVALTFDDAYAALPPLIGPYIARIGIPVTVFVTTGATDRGMRFWWDRVEDVEPRLSSEQWRAFEDRLGVPATFRNGQPAEYGRMRALRQWILATHRGRWPDALEEPLAEIERQHGFTTRQRAMTWDEIGRFAAGGLVDVGVHTISHPVLPLLDATERCAEVGVAYRQLAEHVPGAAPILAIPFGLYDAATVRIAREAGMRVSLTLDNRTLRGVDADAPLPRLSMRSGLRRWKLLARLTVPRRPPDGYPPLPSATT
jgi:peptidoglycan/xylan/chitin deacetylase (PgdA/CDA1 family)